MGPGGLMALALVGSAFLAPGAHAAIVSLETSVDERIVSERVGRIALRLVAAPGERNRVTIAVAGRELTVTDAGASLQAAGTGCTQLTPASVRCSHEDLRRFDQLDEDAVVRLRDGPDELTVTGDPAQFAVEVSGGPGDDTLRNLTRGSWTLLGDEDADALRGGPGGDVLAGGPGPDVLRGGTGDDVLVGDPADATAPDLLDGGPGRDAATYSGTAPVAVNLRDALPDGRPGERDRFAGVEDLRGGLGSNTFIGDDAVNVLQVSGATGAQFFAGAGGDDVALVELERGSVRIGGGAGADRLAVAGRATGTVAGGPGDDQLGAPSGVRAEGEAGNDRLTTPVPRCGAGTDVFSPPEIPPLDLARVPDGCERVDLVGLADVALGRLASGLRLVLLPTATTTAPWGARRTLRLEVCLRAARQGCTLPLAVATRSVARPLRPGTPATLRLVRTPAGREALAGRRSIAVRATLRLGAGAPGTASAMVTFPTTLLASPSR